MRKALRLHRSSISWRSTSLSKFSKCRKLKKEELLLLKSREVIAINQDPLGIAGDRVWKQGPYEVGLPPMLSQHQRQSKMSAPLGLHGMSSPSRSERLEEVVNHLHACSRHACSCF